MSLAIKLRQFMGVIVCEHKGFIGNDTGLRDGAGSETEVRYVQENDEEDDVGGGGDERDDGGCEVGEGEWEVTLLDEVEELLGELSVDEGEGFGI